MRDATNRSNQSIGMYKYEVCHKTSPPTQRLTSRGQDDTILRTLSYHMHHATPSRPVAVASSQAVRFPHFHRQRAVACDARHPWRHNLLQTRERHHNNNNHRNHHVLMSSPTKKSRELNSLRNGRSRGGNSWRMHGAQQVQYCRGEFMQILNIRDACKHENQNDKMQTSALATCCSALAAAAADIDKVPCPNKSTASRPLEKEQECIDTVRPQLFHLILHLFDLPVP